MIIIKFNIRLEIRERISNKDALGRDTNSI